MVGSPAGNVDPAGLSANAVAAGGACASQTGSDWLSIAGNVATAGVAAVPVVGNCFAAFQDIKHGNYWFAALDVGSILGDEIGAGEGEAGARLAANLAADAEKARAAEAEANAAKDVAESGGIVAQNGTKIAGFRGHGIDRAIGDGAQRAGTNPQSILDALKIPESIKGGVDPQGRPYQKFFGSNATVTVGRVVTVWPTSAAGSQ